jgi:hypothetical protein
MVKHESSSGGASITVSHLERISQLVKHMQKHRISEI